MSTPDWDVSCAAAGSPIVVTVRAAECNPIRVELVYNGNAPTSKSCTVPGKVEFPTGAGDGGTGYTVNLYCGTTLVDSKTGTVP